MSSLATLITAAGEQGHELPMHPYAIGALALVIFLVLLGAVWAFRGTAQRYSTGHAHSAHGRHSAGAPHTQAGGRH